jgi:hypothetical protein
MPSLEEIKDILEAPSLSGILALTLKYKNCSRSTYQFNALKYLKDPLSTQNPVLIHLYPGKFIWRNIVFAVVNKEYDQLWING